MTKSENVCQFVNCSKYFICKYYSVTTLIKISAWLVHFMKVYDSSISHLLYQIESHSPSKVMGMQGQFFSFCFNLKTFGIKIKGKYK